jgi:predicted O-methyltransferase YrrM
MKNIFTWLFASRETTNFTYDLTERNLFHLADMISMIVGCSSDAVTQYLYEPMGDDVLLSHIREATIRSPLRFKSDSEPRFGRRLGWYAFARALKPEVIVETGIDKGLGSVLLCSALARNSREGFPGRYYGTDINPKAGLLLGGEYAKIGKILYGDSIESLSHLSCGVDLFINDSDHSAQYESSEYEAIAAKLSPSAVILGDNAHATDSLRQFSIRSHRQFLSFSETPRNHWYPGSGIGISFPVPASDRLSLISASASERNCPI